VGNSLTATNDLPGKVAAIGEREGREIDVRMVPSVRAATPKEARVLRAAAAEALAFRVAEKR
jgi:hypothetical protein